MSEMVERVARAIYASHAFNDNHDSVNPGFDGLTADWREVMMASARAAIEAMRTPTEAMLEAGANIYDGDMDKQARAYRAMIDAAMGVEPNGK